MPTLVTLIQSANVHQDEIIPLLPRSLSELLYKFSLIELLKLVDEFGGQEITIPVKVTHHLQSALGDDLACKLINECVNERFYVPACEELHKFVRNKTVLQLRKQGQSINAISKTIGCCTRTVYAILSKGKKS